LGGGCVASGQQIGSLAASARVGRSLAAPTFPASGSLLRSVALVSTASILIITVRSWVDLWPQVMSAWGADYDFFVAVAGRWLASGEFYAPHQLSGPYVAAINVDTFYPPIALFLFLPFLWLPAVLWWFIPISIITLSVIRCRPAVWVWPFLALMLWWPRTQSIIVWGNTGMWLAAFLAVAIRYRWAAALILLKPSLVPFALVGIRSRGWWLVSAAMALVSLPMLADYIAALRNNVGAFPGLDYSVQDIPFIAIPLIAWMARTNLDARSPGGCADRQGRTGT
jgi:hypothetical protein